MANDIVEKVRDFALCVGARDTWQTKDPRFERGQWISAMLMSKPASYWLTGTRVSDIPVADAYGNVDGNRAPYLSDEEVHVGRGLYEAHEQAVRQAVDQKVLFGIAMPGACTVGLVVFQEQASGFRLCSDVAEAIRGDMGGDTAPFVVVGFSYVVDKPGGLPRLLYSLRGLNGFDVAAFAKANGGGGHTAAAGFSVPLDALASAYGTTSPYGYIQSALASYLKG